MGRKRARQTVLPPVLSNRLVDRIISMMPFPDIFKARCLSKSWNARFSSIDSLDDGTMKTRASLFQERVREKSKNWETFCPVFIDGTKGDVVAYDKKTHNWQKTPSVSFLPKKVLKRFDLQIEGALLCAWDFRRSAPRCDHIYVANILTRTYKKLPLPPNSGCLTYTFKLVLTDRSYKVILFSQRDLYYDDLIFVQIYDSESKLGPWSCMNLDFESYDHFYPWIPYFNSVYLSGVLYMIPTKSATNLVAFDVKQGTSQELKLSTTTSLEDELEGQYCYLMVREDELLMVTADKANSTSPSVLKIDLDSLTLTMLRDGPPSLTALKSTSQALGLAGDEEHIFFGYVGNRYTRMRAYNIEADLWSSSYRVPILSNYGNYECEYREIASFQPGFGTFTEV